MKLGVSMYSYVGAVQAGRLDIVSFTHEAKRIGADGVELLDFFYKDIEAERELAMAALRETGLVCGVFSVAQNFAKKLPAERQVEAAKVMFGVDEAVRYGAKVVRVFAGDVSEGIEFDEARAWIVSGLIEVSNYARDHGVKLALENHGRLAGRSDQIIGIVDEVRDKCGHDALGANPDTGNFLLVGESGSDGVKALAEYAYMVHFKDLRKTPEGYEGNSHKALDGTEYLGTVIGEGEVDLDACVSALNRVGFDGWLNLEYEGEGDPIVDVEKSFRNTESFAR
ncbi:MAG: sugar phosphate isomerase/epimerase [Armatimonadetes bacterium]|nr:sugar phosphate isomerase/epimerase [Armatimonadota bacterium]